MKTEIIQVEVGETPRVVFEEAFGDLLVEGWDQTIVAVRSADAEPAIEESNEAVHVHLKGDARVQVPRGSRLELGDVMGDLAIRNVAGKVSAGNVAGDALLQNVGTLEIDSIAGDMKANGVGGDLEVRQVGADAWVRGVDGDVDSISVGADLALSGVSGDVEANVGADAALKLTPVEDGTYRVTAGAGIVCTLPSDLDLDIEVVSGSGVRSDIGEEAGYEPGLKWSATLGEGSAKLSLTAGANVWIRSAEGQYESEAAPFTDFETKMESAAADFAADFGRWAEDFSERMKTHAAAMAEQVAERLNRVAESLPDVLIAAGMSNEEAQRIAMRVQRSAERAGEQMDRKMREVAIRMERHAERAERQAARHERKAARKERWGDRKDHWGARRAARRGARTAQSSVTEEERMAILRMVEEGKISVEDAARLLAALEGR